MLVDVRAYPRSARQPWFSREVLGAELPRSRIGYLWRGKQLGGFRGKPTENTPHLALAKGMAAYAEQMAGAPFQEAIDELLARTEPTVLMCAERDWRHCHRALISDFLALVRQVEVIHILGAAGWQPHQPHPAARLGGGGGLIYDRGEQRRLF